MNEKIKNLVAIVISTFLSIMLLLTCSMMLFKLNITSPQSYKNAFEEKRIYNEIYDDVYLQINKYISTNNLDEDVVEGIISKNEVVEVVDNYIFSAIGYMKNELNNVPEVDMLVYEARLEANLNKDIRNKNNLDGDIDINNAKIKSDIMGIIKGHLDMNDITDIVSSSEMVSLSNTMKVIDNGVVIVVSLVIVIILCAMYMTIWKRRKTRKFMWMGASFSICGGIMIMTGVLGYSLNIYKKTFINASYLSNALSFVIKKLLVEYSITGVMLLLIGIGFMGIHIIHKIKKRNQELILSMQ